MNYGVPGGTDLKIGSEADLLDQGGDALAQQSHHLAHQQGGQDGALPDAYELAQEQKAQHREKNKYFV